MHRALSQTIVYFLTIAASQGLGFVLLPVVTNYFSPQEYGEYTLALSVSALIATFGSLWVRNLSFRLYFKARAAKRTRAFFLSIAVFQATLVLVLYVPTALVLGSMDYVSLPVMLAAGAAVVASDFYGHSVSLVRAEQQAVHYSVAEISIAVVKFAATLVGLALGIRSASLLFLASALSAGVVATYAAYVLQPKLTGPARFDPGVIRELMRYCLGTLPFAVAGWGERLMDRVILDRFLTRDLVGVYAANYALSEGIVAGLVTAVFLMAWPEILRSWTDDGKEAAREAVTRGLTLYLWLTSGPALFIAVFHRELALLLGPEYRGGSGIMPYIVAATWLRGFATYLNRHLELNLRFATLSWIAFGGAGVNLVANLLLVPRLGMHGAALATVCNLAATGLVFWFIRDRELVRVPRDAMVQVALVLASAFLLSRMPIGTYQRPAVFVVVYAVGTAYFVVRRFWKKEVSMA
jgi:O-antigen/teichoic acid export membrane protein